MHVLHLQIHAGWQFAHRQCPQQGSESVIGFRDVLSPAISGCCLAGYCVQLGIYMWLHSQGHLVQERCCMPHALNLASVCLHTSPLQCKRRFVPRRRVTSTESSNRVCNKLGPGWPSTLTAIDRLYRQMWRGLQRCVPLAECLPGRPCLLDR